MSKAEFLARLEFMNWITRRHQREQVIAGKTQNLWDDFCLVDVMGYSLGGGVALQVAIRHPEVMRKLVVVFRGIQAAGNVSGGRHRWSGWDRVRRR